MLLALAVGAALGQAPAPEDLPELDAQLYRPPVDSERTLWTRDAGLGASKSFTGRALIDVFHGPLGAVGEDGTHTVIVDDVVALELLGGATVGPVRFGAHIPVYALATSDLDIGGGGLGDIALDVKAVALDPRQSPVGIALAGRLGLPTATVKLPLGSRGLSWELEGVVDHRFRDVMLVANLGVGGGPEVNAQNLTQKSAVLAAFGVGYRVSPDAGFSVEVAGRSSFSTPLADPVGSPFEGMVGGWLRLSDNVVLRGGVGTGLTSGAGASVMRTLVGIGYEPRRDEPAMPEAIPDPEPVARFGTLKLKIRDTEGQPVEAEWKVGERSGLARGGKAAEDFQPGEHLLVIDAPGFRTTGEGFLIEAGRSTTLEVTLERVRVKVTRERIEITEKVYFDTNEATIRPESFGLLDEVAKTFTDRADILRVRIEGHTDSRGEDDFNLDLSRRRAASVREYLIDAGVSADRLTSEGYGESRPIDTAENEAAWQQNRRVEFHIEEWAEEASDAE
ncbi:MAG: OmpA family protein [Deltaproteobacteria bacterium]|nr:MAG: OmpA family protein [Deltaproteobacteria bacterium]